MLLPKIFPVTCHTNHVGPGSTFVAISGHKEDGGKFVEQAINLGATSVVVDTSTDLEILKNKFPKTHFIVSANTRKSLAQLSAKALNNPSDKLTIIGITGTKGKTTTAFLTHHILTAHGYKTALISSVHNKILQQTEESSLTTPDSDYLHMFFAQCIEQKVTHVIMEVSSHALSLHRTHGIVFTAVGFTNLDAEHMDFYATLEDYFAAKFLLLTQAKRGGTIVINTDNSWGTKAFEMATILYGANTIIPISQHNPLTENLTIEQNSLAGLNLTITTQTNQLPLKTSHLFGEFNAYNISMAAHLAQALTIPDETIQKAIATFSGTPGRLQVHALKNGAKAFVDFAHNPSSMEAILKTLRPLTNHLIVVFGCGGNRDTTKRPVMGKLSVDYGDQIIITSDNSRNEEPAAIITEIMQGIPQEQRSKVMNKIDRKAAIAWAAQLAKSGSIIAILGKGAEPYLLIKDKKLPFNDLEEISQY